MQCIDYLLGELIVWSKNLKEYYADIYLNETEKLRTLTHEKISYFKKLLNKGKFHIYVILNCISD